MKCSNPNCNHGIGLASYRRGWFSKRRYCSRNCRDASANALPRQAHQEGAMTYFEWLYSQSIDKSHQKLAPAPVRIRA
jgi:hypothetical protein